MSGRHRAAEAMHNAGVKRLPRWGKPTNFGLITLQEKLHHGKCGFGKCRKTASYSTPEGKRCFTHAAAITAASGGAA